MNTNTNIKVEHPLEKVIREKAEIAAARSKNTQIAATLGRVCKALRYTHMSFGYNTVVTKADKTKVTLPYCLKVRRKPNEDFSYYPLEVHPSELNPAFFNDLVKTWSPQKATVISVEEAAPEGAPEGAPEVIPKENEDEV